LTDEAIRSLPVRKRPTQRDIARRAGVSQAAVSLVLAGGDGTRIPADTRSRILQAAADLGYAPNPAARSLVGGRNYLLGFHTFEDVFPADQSDFYFPFLLGVEREATRQGYDLLLFSPANRPGTQVKPGAVPNRLWLADGCVLLGRHIDRGTLADIVRNDFPVVFIGRREVPDLDIAYVGVDYERATRRLVERLISSGHRVLGYIGEPGGGEQSQDRLRGYFDGIAQLPQSERSLKHSKPLTDEELARWIDRGVTAVLVEPGEDDSNVAALEAAAGRLGIGIPAQLSVAVLGDPAFSAAARSDWTRFAVPRELVAERAVRMLVALLDGQAAQRHVLVDAVEVEGGTVAAPPSPA
jgi:DNA-binding LacI/PurR family transcriptional regulator